MLSDSVELFHHLPVVRESLSSERAHRQENRGKGHELDDWQLVFAAHFASTAKRRVTSSHRHDTNKRPHA